jgi:putative hemolysin
MMPRIETDLRSGSFPRHDDPPVVPFPPLRERLRDGAIRLLPGRASEIIQLRTAPRVPMVETYGRVGPLEVRLARTAKEVRRAQRLRYKVFYEEMSAVPSAAALFSRRDADEYDPVCDHLLVLDHDVRAKPFRAPKPKVVGTYRLLKQDVAESRGGFYTAGEFDVAPLLDAHPGKSFLELGRSCVLKPYRGKKTVELLWQGLWAYVLANGVDAMIGCASLDGTDPARLALPLAFLHHHARSPEGWRVCARPERAVAMDALPRDAIELKAAMKALPPLIKGYLRVGATFGDGAVIDRQFGTTDVFVVMPIAAINARYIEHFGPTANRYAA